VTLACVLGGVRVRQGRWCILGLLFFLLALVPLANPSSPDPLWIGGCYDAADFDDVILATTSLESRVEKRIDVGYRVEAAVDVVVARVQRYPSPRSQEIQARSPPQY
jgi:hypothetical protein